jgi:hypothetical protein
MMHRLSTIDLLAPTLQHLSQERLVFLMVDNMEPLYQPCVNDVHLCLVFIAISLEFDSMIPFAYNFIYMHRLSFICIDLGPLLICWPQVCTIKANKGCHFTVPLYLPWHFDVHKF